MKKTKRQRNSHRKIDALAGETLDWWGRSFVFIRKNQVKTWQAVFVIAFFAGMAAAIMLTVSGDFQQNSGASANPTKNDKQAPAVPASLSVTASSVNSVNLKWSAVTDKGGSGLQGYKVYRSNAFLKAVIAPLTAAGDTNLNCGASYSYAVSAIDNAGNESAKSMPVNFMTSTCPVPLPPQPPTNVSAAAVSCTQVSLKWTASQTPNIYSYQIRRNGTFINSVAGTSTSYIDNGVSGANTYLYTVYAVDTSGNPSVASNTASVATPACPTNCIQVITYAKNQSTGECRSFPTPCDVPAGWVTVSSCYSANMPY